MKTSTKKILKYSAIALSSSLFLGATYLFSITSLNDPISKSLRKNAEQNFNNYIDLLLSKAATESLNPLDKTIMNLGTKTGIAMTKFVYPEAATLLEHYVYGDGSDLKISSAYFQESEYLQAKINHLDTGKYGPINLEQQEDWRLSLVFNPYFLKVTPQKVTIFHPEIKFAAVDGEKKPTFIPLGKMKLRVYDNLFSAMNPTPFYAYSEWEHRTVTSNK